MFYETLLEKQAARGEANYHSRYLSAKERQKAFDIANRRRAARQTGRHDSRNSGLVGGTVIGGLGGLITGGILGGTSKAIAGGLGGALAGGGIGYLAGISGDKARDRRTVMARKILRLSPDQRGRLLDHKRARRLEMEDRMRRMEERAHRAQIRNDIQALKNRPVVVHHI